MGLVGPSEPSFVSRYVQYAMPLTSAPSDFHAAVAFALLAAVARRRFWMDFAGDRLYPNLWFCLLGESGTMCKSTSINIGARILRGLGEDLLYPNDFSLQRLYDVMKARPQGILVYREFKALVDLLRRDYMAGAKATLTDVYDCPPYIEYEIKQASPGKVPDPALSILAASTWEWFTGKDTQKDLAGGFLARFVFVVGSQIEAPERQALPDGLESSTKGRDELAGELANVGLTAGRLRLAKEAKEHYRGWFHDQEREAETWDIRWRPFLPRLEVAVLKLAMLLHAGKGLDAGQEIREQSVAQAADTVDRWRKRLFRGLDAEAAFTPHEEQRMRLLKLIPNGGEEVSQRHLLRGLRIRLRDFQTVIDTLQAEGMVKARRERVDGETKVWWARLYT